MSTSMGWISSDLELLPEDGRRREIMYGEIYLSARPHLYHQIVCTRITSLLQSWSDVSDAGIAAYSPGVILSENDDMVPDLAWVSRRRLAEILRPDGYFHGAPELVVEVLSTGSTSNRRDRELKVKVYTLLGVDEYWIADWRIRTIEVFRRDGPALERAATLAGNDVLRSPLLPGFETAVDRIFVGVSDVRDESPGR